MVSKGYNYSFLVTLTIASGLGFIQIKPVLSRTVD